MTTLPTRIAVELVPRSDESLQEELAVLEQFPVVTAVNIPDILRFDMRSWQGCRLVRGHGLDAIAHIRAIDIHPRKPLPMVEYLVEHRIEEVLVIAGDIPQNHARTIYPSTSVDIIRKFKREAPHIRVYAAIDPYRQSFREEMEDVQHKLDVGADGFFTQPFFDMRLMELYGELLEGEQVYWGVSPVLAERSQHYWETRNAAVFPRSFEPTMNWNLEFARQALDFVHATDGFHIYFMPIKTNLNSYLQGIFPR
ncbi:5,10-methylenetetrahydrofolate reductase [Desulfurispirillum indicum S5]|uniref:Methylenetetrahydrofolate reductase n=1 Tax=Desulfurispirillum indicum (strain ATCC BAA-1389 / DSM 22839 / S5) TaxID=653733 RepID=E6W0X3_DESIS|nr:methylenetetrahydrofolate reductase [Desulfurispirillum indicum]ADU65305.1 5,10-methylenetetrahydrofolate reductase [Desulfurispirillum indicum S5]